MPEIIKFYHANEKWGEFSNFYIRSIVITELDGTQKTWDSTELFFQAMKSPDPVVQEYVRTKIKTPGKAKRYCTEQVQLRPDWEGSVQITDALAAQFSDEQGLVVDRVKDHIMFQALVAKFTQHKDLGDLLLETGNAHLVEDTQKVGSDPYWGNGPSGNGLNKLGRMLMLVRKNLVRARAQALIEPGWHPDGSVCDC